jgi:hypothetical protein
MKNNLDWAIFDREQIYETLVKWWTQHGYPIVAKETLPNTIFMVFSTEGDPVGLYAIPVYTTNSTVCWIGFPTSNKEAPKELKAGALEKLIEIIGIVMKSQGFTTLYTTSGTERIIEALGNTGFIAGDQGVNSYYKPL